MSDHQLGSVRYRSTATRYRVLKEAIHSAGPEVPSPDKMVTLLSLHEGAPYSPCVHPQEKMHAATLGTAVFEAPDLTMNLYHGNPCHGYRKQYHLAWE